MTVEWNHVRVVVLYTALVAVVGLSGWLVDVGYCHFTTTTTESVEGMRVEVDLGTWREHWATVLKDWEAESCDADGTKCTRPLPEGINEAIQGCIRSLTTIAESPQVNEPEVAAYFAEVLERFQSGRVRAGIVGLIKAGKSTTLNAFLGDTYLPSTIQPQTAKEVIMVHDPSEISGVLIGTIEGGEEKVIARGADIREHLYWLNTAESTNVGSSIYDKLVLRAPFHFLKDSESVAFEMADTPGTNDGGTTEVSSNSNLALKSLCAFIIVINAHTLRSESESQLLHRLRDFHPELLSRLNRVLFIVNYYDTIYDDKGKRSLKPHEVPQYVSNYLKNPSMLGEVIPPSQIVPYNAHWALSGREWRANPSLVSESDYTKACAGLMQAGPEYHVMAAKLVKEMNDENVRTMAALREDASNITVVEEKLREMLDTYGPQVLLEATLDDTLAESQNLELAIALRIAGHDLPRKTALVSTYQRLVDVFERLQAQHIESLQGLPSRVKGSVASQLAAIRVSLEDRINSNIGSKLMANLQVHSSGSEDMQSVLSAMNTVKSAVASPASAEMEKNWASAMNIIRSTQRQHINLILSDLKNDLTSALTAQATSQTPDANASLPQLVMNMDQKLTSSLRSISPDKLLVAPSLELPLSVTASDSVADNQLGAHVIHGKRTKYRSEQRVEYGNMRYGIMGPRSKKEYYVSIPYDVPTYSPNIPKLQTSFSKLTSAWMVQFGARLDQAVGHSSTKAAEGAVKAVRSVLSGPLQELRSRLESSRKDRDESQAEVSKLEEKMEELTTIGQQLNVFAN